MRNRNRYSLGVVVATMLLAGMAGMALAADNANKGHMGDMMKSSGKDGMMKKMSEKMSANGSLKKAMDLLAEAKKKIQAGDKDAAIAAIEKAETLLKKMSMKKAHPAVVNTKCPIMGNEIDPKNVPDNLYRVYKGKGVGFCCPGCPAKWDKLSDKEKAAKLAAVTPRPAVVNDHCPIMTGNKIDPANVPANLYREFPGKGVGFCCAGCPALWDKLSDEQKAERLKKVTKK